MQVLVADLGRTQREVGGQPPGDRKRRAAGQQDPFDARRTPDHAQTARKQRIDLGLGVSRQIAMPHAAPNTSAATSRIDGVRHDTNACANSIAPLKHDRRREQ